MLREIFAFGATSSMAKHTCLSHVSGMCCRKVPDVTHGLHLRIFVILCCAFKFLGCHTQDFSTLLFWRNKQWNNGTEGGVGENMWKRWNSRRSSFVCCACYKKYLHGYRTARVRKEKGWNGTEAWWTGLPNIHGNDKRRRIRPHGDLFPPWCLIPIIKSAEDWCQRDEADPAGHESEKRIRSLGKHGTRQTPSAAFRGFQWFQHIFANLNCLIHIAARTIALPTIARTCQVAVPVCFGKRTAARLSWWVTWVCVHVSISMNGFWKNWSSFLLLPVSKFVPVLSQYENCGVCTHGGSRVMMLKYP